MAPGTDRHSYIVGWLKLLLPLSALVLLSVLFLFARDSGEAPNVTADQLDAIAQEQAITAPRFSGVANDGSVIEILAQTAKPLSSGVIVVDTPRMTVATAGGTRLSVQAGQGEVDEAGQTAQLTGLVRLDTSTGYVMETEGLIVALDTGTITSIGPLEIQAPYGRLTAGKVTISVTDMATGQQMDFTRGVRLVYEPPIGSQTRKDTE